VQVAFPSTRPDFPLVHRWRDIEHAPDTLQPAWSFARKEIRSILVSLMVLLQAETFSGNALPDFAISLFFP